MFILNKQSKTEAVVSVLSAMPEFTDYDLQTLQIYDEPMAFHL